MLDPHRMVFINIISLTILLIILAIFRFVLHRKVNLLLVLIGFSILPLISLLRPGAYESGDFNLHIMRAMSFFTAIQEGQLIPSWSRDLNATYGYQTFLIGGPLTYYIISIFHLIGLSFITSMKLFLAATYILSGIFMFHWIKSAYNEKAGFITGIFYLFAPFHLVDLHFRESPGDMLLYMLMPLTAYFIFKLFNDRKYIYFLGAAISTMLIMISHPLSLIAMGFLSLYTLFLFFDNRKEIKLTLICYTSLLFGILFSAYFWLPILLEKNYILTSILPERFIFSDLKLFIFTTWRLGFLFQGPNGEISFLIGYIQVIIILYSFYILIKKKIIGYERKSLYFFLGLFFLTFFMFIPISKPFWDLFPILKSVEFSYRLSLITVLLVAVVCGITLKRLDNKIVFIIILFTVSQTILNWGHRRVIPEINDNALYNSLPYSTYQIEGGPAATPKWVNPYDPWMKETPRYRVEFLNGHGTSSIIKRTSINHIYIVNSVGNSYIKENTYYYPGWNLLIDGKKEEINYTNKKFPNVITFKLNKGVHNVELIFGDTQTRKYAKLLSLFSIILFIPVSYFLRKKSFN